MRNAILVLAAAGCNGEKSSDSGDTATAGYEPTWTGVQALFVDHCDRCHATQYPELHTDLATDIGSGYGQWVVAGDPDNSALWQVVSAPSPFQSPMPFDSGLLPAATVDPIREWIANGAPLE